MDPQVLDEPARELETELREKDVTEGHSEPRVTGRRPLRAALRGIARGGVFGADRAERLGRWLANVVELELRVGGRFLLVWKEDDDDQRTDGRIRALEPGRLLELDWTYPGEPDSVARFELRPDGDAPCSCSTTAVCRRARSRLWGGLAFAPRLPGGSHPGWPG